MPPANWRMMIPKKLKLPVLSLPQHYQLKRLLKPNKPAEKPSALPPVPPRPLM
jgi:hypothetical protein